MHISEANISEIVAYASHIAIAITASRICDLTYLHPALAYSEGQVHTFILQISFKLKIFAFRRLSACMLARLVLVLEHDLHFKGKSSEIYFYLRISLKL